MHLFLTTGSSRHALWRRWRWQIARSNVQVFFPSPPFAFFIPFISIPIRWREKQNDRDRIVCCVCPSCQAGLDLYLNEDEWRHEWDNLLKLASSQPRTSGSSTPSVGDETDGVPCGNGTGSSTNGSKTYESLEEIHVLALAHVLKRPIIVIADKVLKVIGYAGVVREAIHQFRCLICYRTSTVRPWHPSLLAVYTCR